MALLGRFDEAFRFVEAHAEVSRRLTPHHRIHAIAMELEVKELMGEWASIRASGPAVERHVRDNLRTPCIRNSRSLFVEAVAHAYGGEEAEARRLEERALELAPEGFGTRLFGPRVRLALMRGQLDVGRGAAPRGGREPRPRLDGHLLAGDLAAGRAAGARRGARKSRRKPGRWSTPARSSGRSRSAPWGSCARTRRCSTQALAGFESFGLDWHAAETRKLMV